MNRLFPVILVGLFTLAGCQSGQVQQQQLTVDKVQRAVPRVDGQSRAGPKVSLISARYETSPNEEFVIPFTARNIVTTPRLNLSFVVQSRGHCNVTYEDTQILLNGTLIESLDFREYEDQQSVSLDIPLPVGLIQNGKNRLMIAMGACDYDIDTMQLNQTGLVF